MARTADFNVESKEQNLFNLILGVAFGPTLISDGTQTCLKYANIEKPTRKTRCFTTCKYHKKEKKNPDLPHAKPNGIFYKFDTVKCYIS